MKGRTERRGPRGIGALLVLLTWACANARPSERDPASEAELLHAAVDGMTDVIVYDIMSPPQASRAYAYAAVAAYEAVRHADPAYPSLGGRLNGFAPAPRPDGVIYPPLAGVQAFMKVGRALTFSQARMDSLLAALAQRGRTLAALPDEVFDRSVAYGDAVAQHVLAWSKTDRFLERLGQPKYSVVDEQGRWVPTPPGYMDAAEPAWATLRPFALDSASQFRPPPPPRYDMTEGSPFYREAREVYDVGRNPTDEQRIIAEFWNNNPYTMHVRGHAMFATKNRSPGAHWMALVPVVARRAGADVLRSAEAYALTAIAIHDGFISCWDEKFRSNLIRPETVINERFDEAWQPLLQTPPFPEYTSGHSVISAAAATVLTDRFGGDFAFADSTEVEHGLPVRTFASFQEAAQEAAMSRLYGGIHYRSAIEKGNEQGRRVGEHVLNRLRTRARLDVARGAAGAHAPVAPGSVH